MTALYDPALNARSVLTEQEREGTKAQLIKEKEEWLGSLVAGAEVGNVAIDTEVIWSRHPAEAFVQACIAGGFDVVMKTAAKDQDRGLGATLFTPDDWHLLRRCPAPVLLVIETSWPKRAKVLAAIEVDSEDAEHERLNRIVLAAARWVADLLDAELHCGHAYPKAPVLVSLEYSSIDPAVYRDRQEKRCQQACREITGKYGVPEEHFHLHEGSPERVIPSIADRIKAELVVLGTVARTGVKGIVMGNTAERMLHNLNCAVLALKPEGFTPD